MHHLEGLNEKQREAVLHTEGPLLIVAGAGAGKTKTITHRILHLILQKHVPPEQILAVTFTNKAAGEMRERVATLLFGNTEETKVSLWPGSAGLPFISTFHSLGVSLLRNNAILAGLPRNFTIFDQSDSLRAIKTAIKQEGFDPKVLEPKLVRSIISKNKSDLKTISDVEIKVAEGLESNNIFRVWKRYERMLVEQNALDFDDLLLKSVHLLKDHKLLRQKYQKFFKYIHVDEYQDTNRIQYELSRLLVGKDKNICVVGDADQNIYSWRGADISNILNFEKDYPGTKVVLLEQNYRSTEIILKAANAVITKNKERIPKNLFTQKEGGEKISIFQCANASDEAEAMTQKIMELSDRDETKFENIAVLYRTNFQSRAIEESLLARGIPYQVLGVKFFARKEVKDLLSYLRAALNPKSIPDVTRSINMPKRGIGKVTIEKIFTNGSDGVNAKLKEKVGTFLKLLDRIRGFIETLPPSEVIARTMQETGLLEYYKEKEDDGEEQLLNMYELIVLAKKYDSFQTPIEGMEKLLEEAALMSEQDTMKDGNEKKEDAGVRLMTVHAAKGLEFPYVFITGLEEGLFPHRGHDEENSSRSNEEERRLFYVAITRAGKKLFLSWARERSKFGAVSFNLPSEFLLDIPKEITDEEKRSAGLLDMPLDTIYFD